MSKRADFFESETPPWVDVRKWKQWCRTKGLSIKEGKCHNHSDGSVHYILKISEKVYDMYANYWDWHHGWQEAIDWIEIVSKK